MVARIERLDIPRRAGVRLAALPDAVATPAYLALLVLVSLVVRTRIIDAPYWIDEGLSVGIASHPLGELPGLLRQDGSPPLYYALLHAWMDVVGRGEVATHLLSLCFALLVVPAAFWAASSVFGRRAGWICAALASLNPFLTVYAQETRMYSLVALFSVLATGAFLHAFVLGRRRYVAVLALLLALLLLTHNWALFLVAGMAIAVVVLLRGDDDRRRHLVDAALVFGGAALVFLPWVPTLLFQVAHTGAPWSRTPGASALLGGPAALFSGDGSAMALLLAGGSGLAAVLSGTQAVERRAVIAMIAFGASPLVLAWASSQVAPAWANRYLAVLIGPLLVLAAVGLARGGRLGVVGLVLVLLLWGAYRASDNKGNAKEVAAQVGPMLDRGDLVIVTHPEQSAVLAHYLPPGLRYASPLGPTSDPLVMDWRDAVERLEKADPATTAAPLLDSVPVGRRLLLATPIVEEESDRAWTAPWTGLVRQRSLEWADLLRRDGRFEVVGSTLEYEETFKGLHGTVYRRVRQ